MDSFLNEDFLLKSKYARVLYHQYASGQPIIDYHCHLSPADIANDRQFDNLTAAWLEGDHYKWRAMRTLGIREKYITGDAPPEEKFQQWAATVPMTIRNPLFHWTHLELKRYFNVSKILTPDTAAAIYSETNELLRTPACTTRALLKRMKVEVVGTTDDPTDALGDHNRIRQANPGFRVLPSFRPDKAFAVEDPAAYKAYVGKLSAASGVEIRSLTQLLEALEKRVNYFHEQGGRLSDHGLEQLYYPEKGSGADPDKLFERVMKGETLSKPERECFKYTVLTALCKMYHQKGWVQQFHLGALRNTNTRMLRELGPDTGFDSIGDFSQASAMAAFFNELDNTDQLAKTILYNLNPADNAVMATMVGNYNDGSVRGKMQFGSAWWFLDQKDGMENQINTLSNLGLLSCFIGMLTDSRSFLSYPRHEYFRRILCNLIGADVENGELPWDEKWLGGIVSGICYENAKAYFPFDAV
ncbi:MAG TPA: glucuronate isomerase [Chryseosolibacter sp.]|nr:glucuronate isomerase [Chryseosolibacter sp.]